MKELRAARSRQAEDVLEVGRAGEDCTHGRRVREAAPRGDETNDRQPAADLEAPVVDVVMRDAVAGEVERNAE
jgi:hypothetical protein